MTTPKKKPVEAVVEEPVEAAPEPEVGVETQVTFDGLRATDTTTTDDGVVSVSRDATFAEQVAMLAPLVLEQAVGIVHHATGGTVSTEGGVITISLAAG